MLSATGVPVAGGWTLLLPVWDFRTPQGVRVEGRGVEPDIAVKYREGRDDDVAAALEFLKTPAAETAPVN
jgi:C-terminal processing protease CtpA/Prc